MIARLSGELIEKTVNWIIVDVHGVGYKVYCDSSKMMDDAITLYTHHHIREAEQSLYGFSTIGELQLFELLITVNGVGPKAAMAIMSAASPDRIKSAIAQSDASLFKSVSGIGQKVAAKIIVELKSKVGGIGEVDIAGLDASNDVVEALETLGYKKDEIASMLRQMPDDISETQDKISWVLKQMGRRK